MKLSKHETSLIKKGAAPDRLASRSHIGTALALAVLGALSTPLSAFAQTTPTTNPRFHLAAPKSPVSSDAIQARSHAVAKAGTSLPQDPWLAPNGSSPYRITDAEQEQADRLARRMVANMSFEEKVAYMGTAPFGAQGQFNLPRIVTSEGVDGVGATAQPSIVYPSAVSLSASWDPALAAERGRQLALDAQAGGVQMVNGPGLNMYRTPYGGRQAEFVSGEDPILGAVLGTAYVEGQQSEGVMAELKHTFANDQESNRTDINETIDEQTLHEIYQLPFEAVIKLAQPAAIMCAFPQINGIHNCENKDVNLRVIEKQWGFDGFIQSDWGAIYDVGKAIAAGTAIDSSGGYIFTPAAIQAAIDSGAITEKDVDRVVYRVIRQALYFKMGKNVGTPADRVVADRVEGGEFSAKAAAEGMVLLKNDGKNLPLDNTRRSIAVLGAFADLPPARPTGSGWAPYRHYVSELEGIRSAAPAGTRVDFIEENTLDPAHAATDSGWNAYYFSSPNWQGYPSVMQPETSVNFDWSTSAEPGCTTGTCGSAVWTSKITPKTTGDYVFKVHGNGAMQVVINGVVVAKTSSEGTTGANGLGFQQAGFGKIALAAGKTYDVTVTYTYESQWVGYLGGVTGASFSYASLVPAAALKDYDAVIVSGGMGGEYEGEGTDHGFTLPEYQDELIRNVASVNPHTTAVIYASTAMDMRKFNDKVASLIYAWYPGQNGGTALANILYGKVNPSGKLPITLDKDATANVGTENFPMPINHDYIGGTLQLDYAEGPYFGYRGYDRLGIKPLYPFGFGLSYTQFSYSNLRLSDSFVDGQPSVDVTFDVRNTGGVDGAEAAQVYVGQTNPTVDRPIQELKGFEKEFLKAGQTKTYTVHLPQRAFSYYNAKRDSWTVDKGAYEISVGSSVSDLKLQKPYVVSAVLQLQPNLSLPIFDPGFQH